VGGLVELAIVSPEIWMMQGEKRERMLCCVRRRSKTRGWKSWTGYAESGDGGGCGGGGGGSGGSSSSGSSR
jgi:hypothetical protein